MNWSELVQAAFVLVVAFALRWFLGVIGVTLSEEVFVSLVSGIVTWLLSLFGIQVLRVAGVSGLR